MGLWGYPHKVNPSICNCHRQLETSERPSCKYVRPVSTSVRLSVRPPRYLLLNNWTKSNQICCVSCLHEWGLQLHIFGPAPWGPEEGPKGQISFNIIKKIIRKSISKIFKQNFVCLLRNEIYKTFRTGFSFGRLGHAQEVGLGGTMGVGGQKNIFFQNSTRFGV